MKCCFFEPSKSNLQILESGESSQEETPRTNMSNEKESTENTNLRKCSVILLDVAGTTTSNSFVKETLFPFAVSNVEQYLKAHWNEEVVQDAVKQLKEGDETVSTSEAVEIVKTLTEKDEANEGLKVLQGLVYKQGYEDGKLKAHVFSDVPSQLEIWSKNHRIAIYSSGSVESQKLLFAHTAEGDLSAHVTHYFDLSVGGKTETSSYENIAKELAVKPEEIAFVSDDPEELKAAKQTGIRTFFIVREGNADTPMEIQSEYVTVKSFADLPIEETSAKRKNEEEEIPEAPPSKVAKTEADDEKTDEKQQKNLTAEEEPMEVDSIDEIKDDETGGETNLNPAADTDGMQTDTTATVENEKTEAIKTEQKEEKVAQKIDAELIDSETKATSNTEEANTNANAMDSTDDASNKDEASSSASHNLESKPKEVLPVKQTNESDTKESPKDIDPPKQCSESVEKQEVPLEKSESKEATGPSDEVQPISKPEITPNSNKVEDPLVKPSSSAARDKDVLPDVEKKIATDSPCPVSEIDSTESAAKEQIESESNNEMDTNSAADESEAIEAEKQDKIDAATESTEAVKSPSKTETDMAGTTKQIEPTTSDVLQVASMEGCETKVEEKVNEVNSTSLKEETNKECTNQDDGDSSKTDTVPANKTEANTTSKVDETKPNVSSQEVSVEAKESGSSSEVKVVPDKDKEETPTKIEGDAAKESETAEEKVNGNKAELPRNDEKENQSELANGTAGGCVEAGNNDVKKNADAESAPEDEIKVKKLEENPDSPAVRVEA